MASLAVRVSFRWVPDDATEPTETHVTSSPEQRYVDIRFWKTVDQANDYNTMQAVHWATAGQTEMSARDGRPWAKFFTFVDSNTMEPGLQADEGFLETLENGDIYEHGSALNPETNKITGYEEMWRPVDFIYVPETQDDGDALPGGKPRTVVLEVHDDDKGQRGRVVCTGQYCQGVIRQKEDFAVQRWTWKDGEWSQRRVGSIWMPTEAAIHATNLVAGQEISHEDALWKVVEIDV